MRGIYKWLYLTLLVALLVGAASAQHFEGRHMVEVQLGVYDHSRNEGVAAAFGDSEAQLDLRGLTANLSYAYFLSEEVSINFGVGIRSANLDVVAKRTQSCLKTESVTQVFCGVRYFVPHSAYASSTFRPFFMGDIGPVVGSQTWVKSSYGGELYTGNQTALGAKLGVGADVLLGSHLILGASLGYFLMTDFDKPVGGYYNHNGPFLMIGLGYLFGDSQRLNKKKNKSISRLQN